jgi:hypothetical protein
MSRCTFRVRSALNRIGSFIRSSTYGKRIPKALSARTVTVDVVRCTDSMLAVARHGSSFRRTVSMRHRLCPQCAATRALRSDVVDAFYSPLRLGPPPGRAVQG